MVADPAYVFDLELQALGSLIGLSCICASKRERLQWPDLP